MKKRDLDKYVVEMTAKRKRLGLSQSDLAKLLGVTLYKITGWETGAVSPTVREYESVMALDDSVPK